MDSNKRISRLAFLLIFIAKYSIKKNLTAAWRMFLSSSLSHRSSVSHSTVISWSAMESYSLGNLFVIFVCDYFAKDDFKIVKVSVPFLMKIPKHNAISSLPSRTVLVCLPHAASCLSRCWYGLIWLWGNSSHSLIFTWIGILHGPTKESWYIKENL